MARNKDGKKRRQSKTKAQSGESVESQPWQRNAKKGGKGPKFESQPRSVGKRFWRM